MAFRDTSGAVGVVARPARTAAHRCSSGATRRPGCAASTTAGSSTQRAPASTCRRSPPRPTSRTRCMSLPIRRMSPGASSGPTSGRRRSGRPSATSAPRAAAGASFAPARCSSSATGCSRWRATSTRRTSPGCTSITPPPTSPTTARTQPGVPSTSMSIRIWEHDRAPRIEVQDEWYGHRYAGLRDTPNGHTHVRVTAYIFPFTTVVAAIPLGIGAGGGLFVPIDDEHCWRFGLSRAAAVPSSVRRISARRCSASCPTASSAPTTASRPAATTPPTTTRSTASCSVASRSPASRTSSARTTPCRNRWGASWTARTSTWAPPTAPCIRMRQQLVKAARDLDQGIEPPAVDGSLDFQRIYGAERILAAGEDWRASARLEDPIFSVAEPPITTA